MICFDLEGPLSPQDNAYEVMALCEGGKQVFEALSKYDDILALENRPGYEPGDTLKLIIPFLLYYGITESDVVRVSKDARIVPGMKETLRLLREKGVPVRIISTSYEQHAHNIGRRLGVDPAHIACTRLPLSEVQFKEEVEEEVKEIIHVIHRNGLSKQCIELLDGLYFRSGLFESIGVSVVGGQRKVKALLDFAGSAGLPIKEVVAVGDSITDYKMLGEVSAGGGLAVAFNANEYCLPYADIALATIDGRALLPVFEAFLQGGKEAAVKLVGKLEEDPLTLRGDFGYLLELDPQPAYNLINKEGLDLKDIIDVHKGVRMMVRGEAGRLG